MTSFKHAQLANARIVAGVALLAAVAASSWSTRAAAAQPVGTMPSVAVEYSAADLSTRVGASKLYQRIALAAREVCPAFDSRDLAAFADSKSCQRRAIASAVEQIGSHRLAAVSGLPSHVG